MPFSTSDGTATQPGDYASNSGTLTFTGTPGETRTFTVNVVGDTSVEANETFNVALGTPSNAGVTLADGNAVGTITNDDSASIAIGDRTLAEGNAGTTAFSFTVALTGAVQGGFTVPFSTANGTATQPGDYATATGTLTFAGTNAETQTVTVNVVGETLVEQDEAFTVSLGTPSNAAVTVSDGSGVGTINNDDTATIAIGDRTLAEGNAGTTAFSFTVTLTGAFTTESDLNLFVPDSPFVYGEADRESHASVMSPSPDTLAPSAARQRSRRAATTAAVVSVTTSRTPPTVPSSS